MSDAHPRRHYAEGEQEQYGRPPHGEQYPGAPQQGYDPYAPYDPYGGAPAQNPVHDPAQGYDQGPYYQAPQGYVPQQQPQPYYGQDPYGRQPYGGEPYQQPQPHVETEPGYGTGHQAPVPPPRQQNPSGAAPSGGEQSGGAPSGDAFHTEQFAFIEEEDEQAEDVIDWLKFTESRTERRDERKRTARKRTIALVVLLVLALAGGVGYLWQAGKIPGLGRAARGAATQAGGAQKRDVIVVHLRQVDSNDSSTALLVGNETTGKGTTVLLPNSLAVATDSGSTTLGKSVVDQGAAPTRDALNTLLGANIQGTWRLDTPYLEILVDSVGDIAVDTDATVKGGGKTLVTPGKAQNLNGQAAVAYATYRGPGEPQVKQLARFGQVMQAVLAKMPSDSATATQVVKNLGAIPDPSLSDSQLGATLAHLADQAKGGDYSTTLLPVQPDGTLGSQATNGVVKDVLGGTVKNTAPGGAPRVAVQNASGDKAAGSAAQVAVVNSGFTYVDAGTASVQAASQVRYTGDAQAAAAKEIAKTLGLPASAVAKGKGAANADITVVLGRDYKPS